MAIPTSNATFKSYCLRALCFGFIDINVSDDQVDDRIDEALQYFLNIIMMVLKKCILNTK